MSEPTTMTLVLVRSCTTSKGPFVAEIQGGTKDSEPMEFPIAEALDLIAEGKGRIPPPYLQAPARPAEPSE